MANEWDVVEERPQRSHYDLIAQYFPEEARGTAAKVMKAESSGRHDAINPNNRNGTTDRGLFQINDVNVPALQKAGIIRTKEDLFYPETNVQAAAFLHQQNGFKPWRSSQHNWSKPSNEWDVVEERPAQEQPQATPQVDPQVMKAYERAQQVGMMGMNAANQAAMNTQAPQQAPQGVVPEWGRNNPNLYGAAGAVYEGVIKPVVQAAGFVGGGIAGLPAGPAGAVAGSGLGYAAANRLNKTIGVGLGAEAPETVGQAFANTGRDIAEGAAMEAGGQVLGKAIGAGVRSVGNLAKQTLGATTGAGPGMIEEALKGSPSFKAAMRGKITGDEIVDNARAALQTIKDSRASAYQQALKEIEANTTEIDTTPILNKTFDLMKRYNVKITKEGVDTSRMAMGSAGRKDVQEIIETVSQWGSQPGDRTASGLDALKRQLDDFYSDSSQARAFVSTLRNEVKATIEKSVPEYAEMTKGYAEVTNLVKDIESGLMMRKNGMSGRITADQTLRRLTSAMRENFEMRKELVEALGAAGGADISGQVAGYAANQLIPRGLLGKISAGSMGYLSFMKPELFPILAASSPRAVGEFINAYGKALAEIKGISPAIYKAAPFAVKQALSGGNR